MNVCDHGMMASKHLWRLETPVHALVEPAYDLSPQRHRLSD